MNVALNKNGCNVRVKTAGKEESGEFYGLSADKPWSIDDGQRMQVHDAMENVSVVLTRDPINKSAQIVAKVHGSGGLNTRQNAWHAQNLVATQGFSVVNCRPRWFWQVRWDGGN